ncbi:hypothetical protein EJB05_37912, partial [Eragrostis curvula]
MRGRWLLNSGLPPTQEDGWLRECPLLPMKCAIKREGTPKNNSYERHWENKKSTRGFCFCWAWSSTRHYRMTSCRRYCETARSRRKYEEMEEAPKNNRHGRHQESLMQDHLEEMPLDESFQTSISSSPEKDMVPAIWQISNHISMSLLSTHLLKNCNAKPKISLIQIMKLGKFCPSKLRYNLDQKEKANPTSLVKDDLMNRGIKCRKENSSIYCY